MFVGIIFGLGSYYVSLLRDQTLKFVGFFNFLYTSNSSYMRDRHPFYLKAPATFVPKQQLLVCGIIFLYIYDCEQWPNTIVITCGYHCTICCRKIKSSKVKKKHDPIPILQYLTLLKKYPLLTVLLREMSF